MIKIFGRKVSSLFLVTFLALAQVNGGHSSGGACLMVREFGGIVTPNSTGGGVTNANALDSNGNLIVVGAFYFSITCGDQILTSAGNKDGFVMKFAPSGQCLASERIGGNDSDEINSVVIGPDDSIYVIGNF